MTEIKTHIVPGNVAPRDLGTYVEVTDAYITEQGTQSGLPIVDFVGRLPNGEAVYFSMTGRLTCWVAAAVRGVNQRIHGNPEP